MIDKKEVKDVADNARIDVTDQEAENLKNDFKSILEIFQKLEEINTEETEPSFHPIDVESTTREDKKKETLEEEQVFQNTSNEEENYFKGPKVK